MKKITYLLLLVLVSSFNSSAQCDIKTNNRPDGNTIKYFNPKPVIRQSQFEVGTAIYKNETSGMYMVNISILFKTLAPKNLTGILTIQTTGNKGLELKLLKSEQIEMNDRKLVMGLYEIDASTLAQLKKFPIKSIYFFLDKKMYGATVTENKNIFINEIKCFNN
jgi:hypothetical protein